MRARSSRSGPRRPGLQHRRRPALVARPVLDRVVQLRQLRAQLLDVGDRRAARRCWPRRSVTAPESCDSSPQPRAPAGRAARRRGPTGCAQQARRWPTMWWSSHSANASPANRAANATPESHASSSAGSWRPGARACPAPTASRARRSCHRRDTRPQPQAQAQVGLAALGRRLGPVLAAGGSRSSVGPGCMVGAGCIINHFRQVTCPRRPAARAPEAPSRPAGRAARGAPALPSPAATTAGPLAHVSRT